MKRYISYLMILALLFGLLAGCTGSNPAAESDNGNEPETVESSSNEPENSAKAEPQASESEGTVSDLQSQPQGAEPQDESLFTANSDILVRQNYPLTEEKETLTIYYSMHPLLGQFVTDPNEMEIYQNVEALTNVHIEFTVAGMMDSATKAQLMIASGDMTDIMPVSASYTYGADAAVEEELIYDLTDLLAEFSPNYNALLNNNEIYERLSTTRDGRIVGYNMFSTHKTRLYIKGPVVRADWLDQLGMDTPETLDDYYQMLVGFRDELGCEYPMWLHYSGINGYDSDQTMLNRVFGIDSVKKLVVDGEVRSSLLEDGFKSYLQTMNQWYSEGLINPDFFSNEREEGDAQSYAAWEYGLLFTYATDFEDIQNYTEDDACRVIAIPDAVQNEGDKSNIYYGASYQADENGIYNITTNCDNPELAMKWLDFFYSPDGWLICNYGVEGVSFEYDDNGAPQWTELLTNNPDLPNFVVLSKYIMLQGAFYYEGERELHKYTEDMLEAADIWSAIEGDESEMINFPAYVTLDMTAKEEAGNLEADIDTYIEESIVKFITGDLNFEADYDTFINTLHTLNIDRVLDLYQQAYDEYDF